MWRLRRRQLAFWILTLAPLAASPLTAAEWDDENTQGRSVSASRQALVTQDDAAVHCASQEELQDALKPITEIDLGVARRATPRRCPDLYQRENYPGRQRAPSDMYLPVHWMPPGLVHKPLYFEDVPLERYGHTCWPMLQPAISGARFLKSTVTLPYRIGLDSPHVCIYDLGYERPGSCAASVHERLPWSWKGAALQTGAVVGGLYMFPLN